MLHLDILDPVRRELLPKFSSLGARFYLAGGTALALQLGHRVSVDFDFFNTGGISRKDEAHLRAITSITSTLVNTPDELTCLDVDGVKISLVSYPFDLEERIFKDSSVGIRMLDPLGIAAAKAYALNRRGVWRDYVDLYFIIRPGIHSLAEIIGQAGRTYGTAFSEKLFLAQLTYLDDITDSDIASTTTIGESLSREEVADFFVRAVRTYLT